MSEIPGGEADGQAPSPPSASDASITAEVYLQQAEAARQKMVWEEAIRLYRLTLKSTPDNLRARRGLAQAYEAKGQEPGGKAFLQMAMEEYRRIAAIDPSSPEPHDALLAAAVRTGQLEELVGEYKVRVAKDPGNEALRVAFRKMQTLFFLQAEPRKAASLPRHKMTWWVLEGALPLVSLLSLVAGLILRTYGANFAFGPLLSKALLRSSWFGLLVYLIYKMFLSLRNQGK